jgi:hypothetical protein
VIICGSFFSLFGLGLSSFLISIEPGPMTGVRHDLTGLVCVGCVLGLMLWLVLATVLSLTAVRATEITDRSITLAGVSDAFADAYHEDRREVTRGVDRTVRERWRQDRDRPWRGEGRYQKEEREPWRPRERSREEEE